MNATKITLRKWLSENQLHLDSSVSDEIFDIPGDAYSLPTKLQHLAPRDAIEWWVCALLIVESSPTGTRVLEEDEEETIREWIDENGDRPHDLTKPCEVFYS